MKKNFVIFIFIVFAVLMFVGCASSSHSSNFTIVLDENPTTGYVWTCSSSDENVAIAACGEYKMDQSRPGLVGVGGERSINVVAVGPGSAEITCSLSRSWEPEPIETVVYSVIVDRFNNIQVSLK